MTILDSKGQRKSYVVLDLDIKHISFTYYKRKTSIPNEYIFIHDVVIVTKQNHVYFWSDDPNLRNKLKEVTLQAEDMHIPLEIDYVKIMPQYPIKTLEKDVFRNVRLIGVCSKDNPACQENGSMVYLTSIIKKDDNKWLRVSSELYKAVPNKDFKISAF